MSTDARDSSIQIFDKFLSFSWVENENILLDINYICFAAVSSVLISSKLHEGSHLLTMGNFPLFPTADLVEFERMLLGKIGYAITPLSTPSSFVRHLLGLCPEYEAKHVELIAQVDVYISEFSENLEYILFAPSTVAISALLIAFSAMKMECGLFIRRIPAVMLPSTKNVQAGDLLEIDKCLSSFQRTSSVSEGLRNQGKRILKVSGSPTSVDVYANNELELDHEHENYAYSPSDQHPSCPVFIDLDAVDKYDHLQDMIKPHASKANTATCNLGL